MQGKIEIQSLSSYEDDNRWIIRLFINGIHTSPVWDPPTCGRFIDFVISNIGDELHLKELKYNTLNTLAFVFQEMLDSEEKK